LGKNKPTSKLQSRFSNGNIGNIILIKYYQEIDICDPIDLSDLDLKRTIMQQCLERDLVMPKLMHHMLDAYVVHD
jgi:hypothetical protein